MRQAGVCWRLQDCTPLTIMWPRLANDHAHASMLEDTLNRHPDIAHADAVDTNIVIFTLPTATSDKVVQEFSQMGIACFAFGPDKVRLVTHLDMTTRDMQEACDRISHIGGKLDAAFL